MKLKIALVAAIGGLIWWMSSAEKSTKDWNQELKKQEDLFSDLSDEYDFYIKKYDNCKVIDEKNWICEYSSLGINSHQKMTKGLYSSSFQYNYRQPQLTDTFSCGK